MHLPNKYKAYFHKNISLYRCKQLRSQNTIFTVVSKQTNTDSFRMQCV